MNCIIEGINFYELEAMKYYSPSTSWSAEKKKETASCLMVSHEILQKISIKPKGEAKLALVILRRRKVCL